MDVIPKNGLLGKVENGDLQNLQNSAVRNSGYQDL